MRVNHANRLMQGDRFHEVRKALSLSFLNSGLLLKGAVGVVFIAHELLSPGSACCFECFDVAEVGRHGVKRGLWISCELADEISDAIGCAAVVLL